MPKVEMSIDLGSIWQRYHMDATTPDDVCRLLLAYDGAKAERDKLKEDLVLLCAAAEAVRAEYERTISIENVSGKTFARRMQGSIGRLGELVMRGEAKDAKRSDD